jgi:hypothetical protein
MDRVTPSGLDGIFERVSPAVDQTQDRDLRLWGRERGLSKAYSRRPPAAVCMSCGHLDYRAKKVGSLCTKQAGNQVCGGFVALARALGRWEHCPSCVHGAGAKTKTICEACGGQRWLFVG